MRVKSNIKSVMITDQIRLSFWHPVWNKEYTTNESTFKALKPILRDFEHKFKDVLKIIDRWYTYKESQENDLSSSGPTNVENLTYKFTEHSKFSSSIQSSIQIPRNAVSSDPTSIPEENKDDDDDEGWEVDSDTESQIGKVKYMDADAIKLMISNKTTQPSNKQNASLIEDRNFDSRLSSTARMMNQEVVDDIITSYDFDPTHSDNLSCK